MVFYLRNSKPEIEATLGHSEFMAMINLRTPEKQYSLCKMNDSLLRKVTQKTQK